MSEVCVLLHLAVGWRGRREGGRIWLSWDIAELLFCEITNYCIVQASLSQGFKLLMTESNSANTPRT